MLKNDLERIYDEQAEALFVCALAVTRCRASAEDAIQDAFSRLLAMDHRPEDLRVYVFRCVRNAAVDIQRRARRVAELHAAAAGPADPWIFAVDPARQAGDGEFAEQAAAALLTLSDDERETIVQHLYAGLTFREIGQVRETPTNTVASWYRRGLEKLREQLESHDGQL